MTAKPEAVGALVNKMAPEEAQAHLARLDAAPGDNPVARAALEARAAAAEPAAQPQGEPVGEIPQEEPTMPPPEREELPASPAPKTLAERRQARLAKQAQRRVQFADAAGRIGPEDVKHTVGTNKHLFTSPNGITRAEMRPDGNLHITDTQTAPGMRSQGEATARAEAAAQVAHAAGGKLISDNRVSAPVQKVYDRLRESGYDVKENPNEVGGSGEKVSASELKGVYEVGPKKDPAQETGMALRRRAAAGDQSAQDELGRRFAATNEPRTPEAAPQQYVARNRDTGEETARYNNSADAQDHIDRFPNDRVTREASEQGALTPRRRDAGVEADMRQRVRLTKPEAEEALKPLLDRVGADGVQVHESTTAATVPPHIRELLSPDGTHYQARGAYDPSTGQVHFFAGSHDDHESLLRTAAHEISGHLGLRRLLGDDFGNTMANIYRNLGAQGKAWARDYADTHDLNLRDPNHQRIISDEYAAHLAEATNENPGAWQKIVDTVRAGLRKLGLVREWNDNDIRALVRRSESGLRSANADAKAAQDARGIRFADADDSQRYERYAPEHPLAQAAKWGKTMEDQANYNPGLIRSVRDTLGEANRKRLDTWAGLGAIDMRHLPDFLNRRTRPAMPSVKQFIHTNDGMHGRIGQLTEAGGRIGTDWSKWAAKNKPLAGNLGELMHASTLGGVDPSKPYKPLYDADRIAKDPVAAALEQEHQNVHARLKDYYNNNLDDKGRELFNTIRDHYQTLRDGVIQGLEQQINESGANEKAKQKSIAALRQKFEAGRVEGVYFPLGRQGDQWAVARDSEGRTVSFARFESGKQKKAWLAEAKARGFDTENGQYMDTPAAMEKIDPEFVKQVTEMAKDVSPQFADEVWQAYLKSMPETALRRQNIHRIGRLGYTMDAMRNFAQASLHGANQIARLEYGHKLEALVTQMKNEAHTVQNTEGMTDADKNYTTSLAKEFGKRLDWIKNPKAGPVASALTRFGFGWYLGHAPATALRILTQNPMLAFPVLSKYHGPIGAARELSRAMAQWATSKGPLKDLLRGDERQAMEDAHNQGVFANTWAQTLASGGEGAPMGSGYVNAFMRNSSFLFNKAEQLNRESTYLAAYRLGRKQEMTHAEAQEHATSVAYDAHFDYASTNRPRPLQSDAGKVLGLFKQYSWGVTYRLAREFRNSVRMDGGLSPGERAQAMRTFGGLIGMGYMFHGVVGMPFHWAVSAILNSVFGDKDHPYDSDEAMHEYVEQAAGTTAANAVSYGPVSAITGANLSSGASYNDLWYRPPSRQMSASGYALDALGQFAGAVPGIALNAAAGATLMSGPEGNIERGFEHFVPPEAAALMKTLRYYREGAQTLGGDSVLSPDEVSNRDLFVQALGFTPLDMTNRFAKNASVQNLAEDIEKRRSDIMESYSIAATMGDGDGVQRWMDAVQHFNDENPSYAIMPEALYRAAVNRYKEQAESVNGIRLPKALRGLEYEYGSEQ